MKTWDVFIFEYGSRKIETLAGSDLPEAGSFHTVQKRIDTVLPRLSDKFGVIAVPAGQFKVGDLIPQGVEEYV